MKILLIHQYFLEKDDGGGSRFNELTRLWSSMGSSVTVIAGMVHYATGNKLPRYKGKYVDRDTDFYRNVDVWRTHVSESYNSSFLGRLWAYFSFVFSSLYVGIFKINDQHDVVLVTSPPLFVGITAYLLSRLKGLPLVFEVRDLWPESAIDTGVLKNKWLIKFAYAFESFIYRKADLVNVLTPAFREALIKKGVPASKIIFMPNAADFSLAEKISFDFKATEFKKEIGLENKFVITYVGAHGVANHLDQLLDAAALLRDTKVVFQLIGAGMMKDQLIEKAGKMQLDNVIFRDPVAKAEVFKYILASDMGAAVLKKVDTFKTIYSNKTFDYMSCRIPVLLAIDGVSRELVQHADCGIYVEPENAEAIANGIRSIMEDKDRLVQMGNNGYDYAMKNFDRESIATAYLKELNQLA